MLDATRSGDVCVLYCCERTYLFALAKGLPCVSELAIQLSNVLYMRINYYC
jgi:hypothetical protein